MAGKDPCRGARDGNQIFSAEVTDPLNNAVLCNLVENFLDYRVGRTGLGLAGNVIDRNREKYDERS